MNEDRAELLALLFKLRARYPDWRFGQLFSNVAGWADENAWDIEDERIIAAVEEYLRKVAPKSLEMNTTRA